MYIILPMFLFLFLFLIILCRPKLVEPALVIFLVFITLILFACHLFAFMVLGCYESALILPSFNFMPVSVRRSGPYPVTFGEVNKPSYSTEASSNQPGLLEPLSPVSLAKPPKLPLLSGVTSQVLPAYPAAICYNLVVNKPDIDYLNLPIEPRLIFRYDHFKPRAPHKRSLNDICGIYVWLCTANRQVYLGSSINLYKRAFSHVSLEGLRSTNLQLSQTILKYGLDSMVLLVFPICAQGQGQGQISVKDLAAWEEYLINLLPAEFRLNTRLFTSGLQVECTDTLDGSVTIFSSQNEAARLLSINRQLLWSHNQKGSLYKGRYAIKFLPKAAILPK